MTSPQLEPVMRAAVDDHRAGRLDAAEAGYRRAFALEPEYSDALHMLGLIAVARGRPGEAVGLIRRAIVGRPNNPEAYLNLGAALEAAGDIDAAREAWSAAVAQRPTYVGAVRRLGASAVTLGRWDEAAKALRRAIELAPDDVNARVLLGASLREMGRLGESIEALNGCLAIDPNCAEAYANLSGSLGQAGRIGEGVAAGRAAVRLDPGNGHVHSGLCYAMHYDPAATWPAIRAEHDTWRERHADPLAGEAALPHENDRRPGRPLRVGYVSPDLVLHPVGRLLLPVLRAHDRDRVVAHVYSTGSRRDDVTADLAAAAAVWRDAAALSDADLAAAVRRDGIDVLVDLSVHSAHNRLGVFARKPAPVQVSWLGYPGTTGMTTVDYRLGDAVLDPPGTDDQYTERTVRLPTYWCYPPPAAAPPVAEPPSERRGHVTFASLNNFVKVNDRLIGLWASLLARVPGSRLLLHSKVGGHWRTTTDQFAAAGVDPGRVAFVGYMPYGDYFRQYHNVDVALDTMPYGGGITTCDALYMGVPVVTRRGATAVGRIGAAMLAPLGLDELVAETDEQYAAIAAALATDRPRLRELRRTLRDRMLDSPLTDAAGFTRSLEAAYAAMWAAYCRTDKATVGT